MGFRKLKKKKTTVGIISSTKQKATIWRDDFHTLMIEVALYYQV